MQGGAWQVARGQHWLGIEGLGIYALRRRRRRSRCGARVLWLARGTTEHLGVTARSKTRTPRRMPSSRHCICPSAPTPQRTRTAAVRLVQRLLQIRRRHLQPLRLGRVRFGDALLLGLLLLLLLLCLLDRQNVVPERLSHQATRLVAKARIDGGRGRRWRRRGAAGRVSLGCLGRAGALECGRRRGGGRRCRLLPLSHQASGQVRNLRGGNGQKP